MVDVERLVIFAILMENDEGIVNKSIDYIFEKWEQVIYGRFPEQLLDPKNMAKLDRWKRAWLRKNR